MLRRLSTTHAMAVALLALFLSLAGGAYAQLSANSVGTRQLRNRAVTHAKLANNSIRHANLGGGVVRNNNLARNSVFHANLGGGVVRNNNLARNSVFHAQLGAGVVWQNNMNAGLISELRGAAGPAGPAGAAGAAGPAGPAGSAATSGNFQWTTTTALLNNIPITLAPGASITTTAGQHIVVFARAQFQNLSTGAVVAECQIVGGPPYSSTTLPSTNLGLSVGEVTMVARLPAAAGTHAIQVRCQKSAVLSGTTNLTAINMVVIATG